VDQDNVQCGSKHSNKWLPMTFIWVFWHRLAICTSVSRLCPFSWMF